MTIEDLTTKMLGWSAADWEKMTDSDLEKYFAAALPITRPELGAIPRDPAKPAKVSTALPRKEAAPMRNISAEKLERAKAIAKQLGMDLDF
jgi:hypothetical protein